MPYTTGKAKNGSMKTGLKWCSIILYEITISQYQRKTSGSLKRLSLANPLERKLQPFFSPLLSDASFLVALKKRRFFSTSSQTRETVLMSTSNCLSSSCCPLILRLNQLQNRVYSSWFAYDGRSHPLVVCPVSYIDKQKPFSESNPQVSIVNSARVLDNQICYDIKDANHIYEICQARCKLHKLAYSHKTSAFLAF